MKKILLVITLFSSFFLTGCGEKNTITYDKKAEKVTFSELDPEFSEIKYGFKAVGSSNSYSMLKTLIDMHCSEEQIISGKKQLKEKGSATFKDCDKLTIKLINFE